MADLACLSPLRDIFWYLLLAVVLCVALPLIPVLVYMKVGWRVKRDDIHDSVSGSAKVSYLKMFALNTYHDTASDPDEIFQDFYTRWYGRRHYVPPLLLFIAVQTVLAAYVAISAASLFPYWKDGMPGFHYGLDRLALMSISGAYLWVSSDFITRARRLDFAPSDIHWGTLRLVISVPMGHAFVSMMGAKDSGAQVLASVLAFGLGAFPLAVITDMLRQWVYKAVTRTVEVKDRTDAVTRLQGVDDDIAIRLQNEGITTIPQIAYCDPIRLVMRANLSFNFVIDCMNQSLSWVYFEEQMKNLRPLGLRGAVEISYLMQALKSPKPQAVRDAEATLADVVSAIKPPHTVATLRYTLSQIADDPYTHFLNEIWVDPLGKKPIPKPVS